MSEEQTEATETRIENTMKYAKRLHKNKHTFVEKLELKDGLNIIKVKRRRKKKSYISLKEFIRKNKNVFVNPKGKLKRIIEDA